MADFNLDSTCSACGTTFVVTSPDDWADLWRNHRCNRSITIPCDLLRRLMFAAERSDMGEILDVQSEVAKILAESPGGDS